jgi:hypothetical protein
MEDGRAPVSILEEPLERAAELRATLERLHKTASLECPALAPKLQPAAAYWAANILYRGCQFLVLRDVGEPDVRAALSVPCPAERTADAIFSVDLTLRHLPRLLKLARNSAMDDPLCDCLLALAKEWPLSSVGASGVGLVKVDGLVNHPGLWGLYIDRVLQTGDTERLTDPHTWEAAATALGGATELCPTFERMARERSTA